MRTISRCPSLMPRGARARPSLVTVLPVFLLLHTTPAPTPAAEWSGQRTVENGVVHVLNPTEPIERETLVLVGVEEWRVGGDSDDPADFFGVVSGILRDEDGRTYVLDTQLNELKVFGPEGNLLHQLGRRGEAPGEFQSVWRSFLLPPDRIGVVQTMPARIVVFGRDGSVRDDLRLPEPDGGGQQLVVQVEADGGNLVLELTRTSIAADGITATSELVSATETGQILATYAEKTDRRRLDRILVREEDGFSGQWHVDGRGRVWIAPYYDRYRLDGYDPNGTLTKVVERKFELRQRSEEELEERKANMAFSGPMKLEFEYDLSPTDRAINSFVVQPNGEMWVMDSYGAREGFQDGAAGRYDVFDAEGHYLRRVELRLDRDRDRDAAFVVGDHVYVVYGAGSAARSFARAIGLEMPEVDEESPLLEIVCLRLVPSTGG